MKLSFNSKFRAIPTLGGIITEARSIDSSRFPDAVCLPVTHAAVQYDYWMVCVYEGRGVAMTPSEARALGLTECRNWYPDIKGVRCVPGVGEIAKHLGIEA